MDQCNSHYITGTFCNYSIFEQWLESHLPLTLSSWSKRAAYNELAQSLPSPTIHAASIPCPISHKLKHTCFFHQVFRPSRTQLLHCGLSPDPHEELLLSHPSPALHHLTRAICHLHISSLCKICPHVPGCIPSPPHTTQQFVYFLGH